ncbi:MAG: hypothetical protein ACLRMG_15515, partial [Clostridium sp.]
MEDNNKGRNGLLKQGVDKLFNTFEEKYGADFSDEGCQNALNFLDNMDKFLLTAFAPLYSEISYIGEIFSNIKMGYEETKGIKENTQEYMKNESENLKNYFGDAITEGINFGREVGGEIFTGLAAEQSKVFSIYNFVDDLKDRFNATKEFIGQTKEFIDKSKEIKATLDEQVRQELTYNLSDKEENIDIDDIYEKIKDTDSKENEESNQDIENEN